MPKQIRKRGPRGAVGPRGRQGVKGEPGATGREGPPTNYSAASGKGNDVLEIVERQIDDIHQELDVQMKRIAQLQAQMDELRATVRRVMPAGPPS
jgi:hypothetical protein